MALAAGRRRIHGLRARRRQARLLKGSRLARHAPSLARRLAAAEICSLAGGAHRKNSHRTTRMGKMKGGLTLAAT